ncbi:hypothetical protein [Trichococcus collinsii]|uniref:Uncharacterized protein n=1 Tax=Trichococcus collinsii TaxID=157076 RepID=A0AB38A246_9LACT|nr:hypothetical protein [Trichococcus collinsii]CZR05750.1 Hypothetical protein Tcol_2323 [Trichococcus collinsii]SEA74418.1 hypothetical protein SAMN04488525_10542 [Trichococcus collinsii]
MTMTKEQFEHYGRSYERIVAAGGPKSQSEAMLYHQYKQQKQQLDGVRQVDKEQFQSELIEKLVEVQQLERSIEKLQGQLQNEKIALKNMTETLVLLEAEV